MEPTVMQNLMDSVGSVTTTLFNIVTQAVNFIVGKPLMLVFFSIAIVGAGIGLFQRLRG